MGRSGGGAFGCEKRFTPCGGGGHFCVGAGRVYAHIPRGSIRFWLWDAECHCGRSSGAGASVGVVTSSAVRWGTAASCALERVLQPPTEIRTVQRFEAAIRTVLGALGRRHVIH